MSGPGYSYFVDFEDARGRVVKINVCSLAEGRELARVRSRTYEIAYVVECLDGETVGHIGYARGRIDTREGSLALKRVRKGVSHA